MSLMIRPPGLSTWLLVILVMMGCDGRAAIREADRSRINDHTVPPSPIRNKVFQKGTLSTLAVDPLTAPPTRALISRATPITDTPVVWDYDRLNEYVTDGSLYAGSM